MVCYTEEELVFENPLFRRVTTSYLITMRGSARRASYMKELADYRITSRVVVVHNAGFRRCEKEGVSTAAEDLWHANQYVARRALAAGNEAVFILEDDVRFLPQLRRMAPHIEDLMSADAAEPTAYTLGTFGFVSLPSDALHVRVWAGALSHAILYNQRALGTFADLSIRWVHDAELYPRLKVYAPRKCCAVQDMDFSTENSTGWNVLNIPAFVFHAIGGGDTDRLFERLHVINEHGGLAPIALATLLLVLACVCALVRLVRRRGGVSLIR